MKWVALSTVLVAAMFLFFWLRENPKGVPKVLMLMGFLPFALAPFHLYMAAISWADWPGYVKGAEVSVLDAIALAVYFAVPGPRSPLLFRISMGLYFVAVMLSVLHADVPMAAMFYPWQLARMFLIYAAVAKACARPDCVSALLKGLAAGIVMEAGVAVWERFVLGYIQAGGTVGHQNLLGLVTHFAVFPLFALLLAGRQGWVPPVGTFASLVVQALTTSRATVGLAALGYFLVFAFSALRGWTTRTTAVFLIAFVAAVALTPVLTHSFEQRFAAQGTDPEYDERAAFADAARAMISDHPLGVGPNYYVVVANVEGYNSRAGVIPVAASLGANVHNLYLLVTAETGYFGLITFVFAILCPMVVAFHCGLRHRGDERGEMLIGIGVALLAVYLHSFFEWIFVTYQVQYVWALDAGVVAGLTQQLGYRRRSETQQFQPIEWVRFRVEGQPSYHSSVSPPGGTDSVRAPKQAE